ncbi:type III-B CRISPR module RAMP protein Cmr6 [Laceyella sacchari]|nr:type III-B CRISPR module RAMP protein Cmr6 [Laceyella sacchari]
MMPLYVEANTVLNSKDSNMGLCFEKFCDQWEIHEKYAYWTLEKKKQAWMKSVSKSKIGDAHQLNCAVKRMEKLIQFRSGKLYYMKTISRFVPGMGRSNPVDNGLTWHHTLGVPYLPGSSIKGILRSWATSYDTTVTSTQINDIFGPIPEESNSSVGSVVFFDALPVAPVQLEIDIMTPHHPEYYKDPKKGKPVDWESPNPIPFLTVAEGQTFVFGVAPRCSGNEGDQKAVQMVTEWLPQALDWIGAGAKTAWGYGRFASDSKQG